MSFAPSAHSTVQSVYGDGTADTAANSAASSYLDMASQYAPILKTLLFDEDPRIEYAKKSQELSAAITSYKSSSGIAKNALASKIRSLQAEISGLSAQASTLDTSEALSAAGKATGVGLLLAGVGAVALVGYLLYEKAATERARRHQISSGKTGF